MDRRPLRPALPPNARGDRFPRPRPDVLSPPRTMRLVAAAAAALVALALAGSTGATTASGPCGFQAGAPAHVSHVIWIWFENHAAGEIVDNRAAPRTTKLADECGFAERYYAVAHPSLPNYLAATSGSTQGVSDDGAPATH